MVPVSPNEPKERTTGATEEKHWIIRADPRFTRHEGGTVIISGGTVYGDGYAIVPAADVLTSEMRADIAWVCGIVGQIDHFNMDEWPVIERLRAIADGGAK